MTHSTIGIVGLGTMGAGIAQVCLEAGHRVIGVDVEDRLVDAGQRRIQAGLDRRVAKNILSNDAAQAARDSLRLGTDRALLADAGVVIEAVVEQLAAKQELFVALERVVNTSAILATNTSALSVTAIASACEHPERVVGLHFFNPAPLMALVEVIRTPLVSDDVYTEALRFAAGLGKEAVPCPDTPGFLVNRLLIPILNDAIALAEETGASPDDIDRAMRFGAGWPMGPFALADLVGLDVHRHAAEALWQARREPRMAPPPRLVRMVEAGRFGKKTGRGFYDYEPRR